MYDNIKEVVNLFLANLKFFERAYSRAYTSFVKLVSRRHFSKLPLHNFYLNGM